MVDHLDRTQRSTDKDIIDKNTIDKDINAKDIIDKDIVGRTAGNNAIPSETTKQSREQHRQQGGDVPSDDVRSNRLPALIATVSTGEEQRSEGSDDSAAKIKSIIGDLSEKCEEVDEDSLIRATGGDVDSLQSKAVTATMAPQATSVDISGKCTPVRLYSCRYR